MESGRTSWRAEPPTYRVGCTALDRWAELEKQLRDRGVLTEDIDLEAIFTGDFRK